MSNNKRGSILFYTLAVLFVMSIVYTATLTLYRNERENIQILRDGVEAQTLAERALQQLRPEQQETAQTEQEIKHLQKKQQELTEKLDTLKTAQKEADDDSKKTPDAGEDEAPTEDSLETTDVNESVDDTDDEDNHEASDDTELSELEAELEQLKNDLEEKKASIDVAATAVDGGHFEFDRGTVDTRMKNYTDSKGKQRTRIICDVRLARTGKLFHIRYPTKLRS